MVRLMKVAPNRWALKGGMAIESRLGERARASVDLDADHVKGAEVARADLQRAQSRMLATISLLRLRAAKNFAKPVSVSPFGTKRNRDRASPRQTSGRRDLDSCHNAHPQQLKHPAFGLALGRGRVHSADL
jgi:hypothetical protein